MTATNATCTTLATTLSDARKGTFTGLVIRKEGVTRGRGPAKLTYGDDLVHVVIVSGFRYERLVTRSLAKLNALVVDDIVAEFSERGVKDGEGNLVGKTEIEKAVADLRDSFTSTLAGTNESTTDHVFDPLVVEGETVRGARVYKCVAGTEHPCHCRNCTGDPKAPLPGQINLSGLKIGEVVLEAAKNGPVPPSKSRGDVVAKNILRSRLPVGRYVSYRLEPGDDYILRAGGTAALAADSAGVSLDPRKVADVEALLTESA
jgi:hypothetical protein